MMSVKILDITKVHQIRMSCKYIRCYKGASDHDVLYRRHGNITKKGSR